MPEPTFFDNLRIWSGSQSRAFEEVSNQLLKSEVPSGSPAIRCERRKLDRDEREHHGWEDSYRSAVIDSDLRIHLGETIREQR